MAAAKADEWQCRAVTRSRRASPTTGKVMQMPGESVRDQQWRVCRARCPLCVAKYHCVWQKKAAACGKQDGTVEHIKVSMSLDYGEIVGN